MPKKFRFTDKAIANLKPPAEGQDDWYDTAQSSEPGFGLRVSHHGRKTWFIKFVRNGKQQRKSLRTADGSTAHYPAMSLAKARGLARDLKASLRQTGFTPHETRLDVARAKEALISFKTLSDQFYEDYASKKRSSYEDKRILGKYFNEWQERPAAEITRTEAAQRLRKVAKDNGPMMANRCQATVRKMYNEAISDGILPLEINPFAAIGRPGGDEESRDRIDSPDELSKLWAAFGQIDIAGLVFKFLLVTGQRLTE
ncbi:MAG: Arm DNA-binding domain-containing protein, partial [Alphaproteobacteria bacterium]|nr:Arm DNA-binding domain-containing protein [Alphaproteobacteria bacterium]